MFFYLFPKKRGTTVFNNSAVDSFIQTFFSFIAKAIVNEGFNVPNGIQSRMINTSKGRPITKWFFRFRTHFIIFFIAFSGFKRGLQSQTFLTSFIATKV